MALRIPLEKFTNATSLREMIGFAAQRLMKLAVGETTGATHGERSPGRLVQRNGYRRRDWPAQARTVEQRIPKRRRGSHFPAFPEPRRIAEMALAAVIQKAYVQRISTLQVGWTASASAKCRAFVSRSTTVSATFLPRPSRGTGPTSGWMPPT